MPIGGKQRNEPKLATKTTRKLRIAFGQPKEDENSFTMKITRYGEVDATFIGPFAVHTVNDNGLWHVSSAIVGQWIVVVRTFEDAVKMAEAMEENCRLAYTQPTAEKMVALLEPWMKEWARAVRKKKAYLDPEPFRQAQHERR